ncbi:response regulator transcription factor [Marinoscillum sp.]|uniref:response regulator transcription factor n=1 Tax=Marinoscillum sp. TaxID=2024838 RepID=UPI003BAA8040
MKQQILLIDDNPMMGGFLTHMFRKEYNVMWCTTAEEALSWMHKRNLPSLIVCDYELTGMSGLDFLYEIKSTGFYKDIPVLMLSGKSNSESRIKCLKAGAEDFVLKPFNPDELSIKVENLLSKVATN